MQCSLIKWNDKELSHSQSVFYVCVCVKYAGKRKVGKGKCDDQKKVGKRLISNPWYNIKVKAL